MIATAAAIGCFKVWVASGFGLIQGFENVVAVRESAKKKRGL
jgi:hypothetical protein